jgi:DNA-binding transcriptional regulator LsrR (DeoR family)
MNEIGIDLTTELMADKLKISENTVRVYIKELRAAFNYDIFPHSPYQSVIEQPVAEIIQRYWELITHYGLKSVAIKKLREEIYG